MYYCNKFLILSYVFENKPVLVTLCCQLYFQLSKSKQSFIIIILRNALFGGTHCSMASVWTFCTPGRSDKTHLIHFLFSISTLQWFTGRKNFLDEYYRSRYCVCALWADNVSPCINTIASLEKLLLVANYCIHVHAIAHWKRESTGASFLYWLDWKSKHFNWLNVNEWKATQSRLRVFNGKLSRWEPCKSCKIPYKSL